MIRAGKALPPCDARAFFIVRPLALVQRWGHSARLGRAPPNQKRRRESVCSAEVAL